MSIWSQISAFMRHRFTFAEKCEICLDDALSIGDGRTKTANYDRSCAYITRFPAFHFGNLSQCRRINKDWLRRYLSQLQLDGAVRLARFEIGIWSEAKWKYDAVKLECRELLKALKKFRFWLFGRTYFR